MQAEIKFKEYFKICIVNIFQNYFDKPLGVYARSDSSIIYDLTSNFA